MKSDRKMTTMDFSNITKKDTKITKIATETNRPLISFTLKRWKLNDIFKLYFAEVVVRKYSTYEIFSCCQRSNMNNSIHQ